MARESMLPPPPGYRSATPIPPAVYSLSGVQRPLTEGGTFRADAIRTCDHLPPSPPAVVTAPAPASPSRPMEIDSSAGEQRPGEPLNADALYMAPPASAVERAGRGDGPVRAAPKPDGDIGR